jgi:hypothetical protein
MERQDHPAKSAIVALMDLVGFQERMVSVTFAWWGMFGTLPFVVALNLHAQSSCGSLL